MEAEEVRLFSPEQSKRLIELGFDSGEPVYRNVSPGFGLDEVTHALLGGTFLRPQTIPLMYSYGSGIWQLPVVPELLQVTFEEVQDCHGRADVPDWYVRGYLPQSPFKPGQPVYTVHLFLAMFDPTDRDEIENVYFQLVDRPARNDGTMQLRHGEGPLF